MRSTLGVSRVFSFGADPVRVPDALVEHLRQREADMLAHPQALFVPGQRVRLVEPPFEGLEAIYQMADGESRVMVLIEILSRPVQMLVAPVGLRRVG
jgi:transcriptional antiterminator RfaH